LGTSDRLILEPEPSDPPLLAIGGGWKASSPVRSTLSTASSTSSDGSEGLALPSIPDGVGEAERLPFMGQSSTWAAPASKVAELGIAQLEEEEEVEEEQQEQEEVASSSNAANLGPVESSQAEPLQVIACVKGVGMCDIVEI